MAKSKSNPRFAIRLVHLSVGWRYWAFELGTAHDVEVGLNPNGYGTEVEAEAAIEALDPWDPAFNKPRRTVGYTGSASLA